jgi:hypothetical protein
LFLCWASSIKDEDQRYVLKNDVKSILSTWYMDVPFIFHFNMTGFECLLWNSLQIGPSKIWFDYTMYIFYHTITTTVT